MYNLSVTDINTHMTVIADHIPREHLRLADCTSASCQRVGITGCGNTTCRMDQMNKTGTVRSVGQAVSSIYIRIADMVEPPPPPDTVAVLPELLEEYPDVLPEEAVLLPEEEVLL